MRFLPRPLIQTSRLLVACGLGLVIGIDREARDRPAGLRTDMLTALAAVRPSLTRSASRRL